ncbi:hypothetical protein KNV09_gp116 [Vibrio phage Athena]|uniref:Uncharacterized protein n=3 Tax=Thalassavirus TaxID=2948922 RepID=A0A6M9Z1V7_9CAUD|nr:hypothetical protein KNU88_gp116 [Vibrio phage Chester]YP_010108601.1 hypothetical protein KNV08_gp119 [Vibrio phage Quinn]YP_010108794.1 hypothetical protein KNV09_gp116 [Vibrio phage Athena]QIG66291.1 hypothetical protein CILSICK_192 [Vibrio phage Cilsick]WBU76602.1 hypothetical protein CHLORIS_193 [Vibrio phage Chloris]WBU77173.1 hypothetical protein NOELLE_189 [Vibrio phage Noelle]WCD55864.1 hypothetical protein ROCKET24_191 [Vibrio phage Rocket24]QIN96597.1 hypothetical protein CHEST
MVKVIITFGCYLETCHEMVLVTNRDTLTEAEHDKINSEVVYPMAIETTDGWVGSNGFCEDLDDAEDIEEAVEDEAFYYSEIYDPEKHDGFLMGCQDEWQIIEEIEL